MSIRLEVTGSAPDSFRGVPVPASATVSLPGVGTRPVIPARCLRPGDAIVWALDRHEYVTALEEIRRRFTSDRLRLFTIDTGWPPRQCSRVMRPDARVPFESLGLATGARLEFRLDEIAEV